MRQDDIAMIYMETAFAIPAFGEKGECNSAMLPGDNYDFGGRSGVLTGWGLRHCELI